MEEMVIKKRVGIPLGFPGDGVAGEMRVRGMRGVGGREVEGGVVGRMLEKGQVIQRMLVQGRVQVLAERADFGGERRIRYQDTIRWGRARGVWAAGGGVCGVTR